MEASLTRCLPLGQGPQGHPTDPLGAVLGSAKFAKHDIVRHSIPDRDARPDAPTWTNVGFSHAASEDRMPDNATL
jgi:hypothetical protein